MAMKTNGTNDRPNWMKKKAIDQWTDCVLCERLLLLVKMIESYYYSIIIDNEEDMKMTMAKPKTIIIEYYSILLNINDQYWQWPIVANIIDRQY